MLKANLVFVGVVSLQFCPLLIFLHRYMMLAIYSAHPICHSVTWPS